MRSLVAWVPEKISRWHRLLERSNPRGSFDATGARGGGRRGQRQRPPAKPRPANQSAIRPPRFEELPPAAQGASPDWTVDNWPVIASTGDFSNFHYTTSRVTPRWDHLANQNAPFLGRSTNQRVGLPCCAWLTLAAGQTCLHRVTS